MHWINQFAKGTFGLFAGQVIEGLQPIDFYHFFPLWYDLWIKRIAEVIRILNLENKSFQEVRHLLPPPSNIRAILVKIIPTYQGYREQNIDDCRLVVNFLARMLVEGCPDDPFAISSNPYHSEDEVNQTVKRLQWTDADVKKARSIGQLITAAGSLVHGLYNDLVTDFGWDVYGPYSVTIEGNERSFLIRHFPDLSPKELWSKEYLSSIKEILIYATYESVEWEILGVGCHTISRSGVPVQGMRTFAVTADGKYLSTEQIHILVSEISQKAEVLYREIRKMDFEKLKSKVMLQECYQLKKMFDSAGIDWQPTEEMKKRIVGKALLDGILPRGKMMTDIDEYKNLFGIAKFAQEVLGEQI
ncbi:MAG: hypothetical protein IPJ68_03320 [Candidatus Moraniibacteriota bacterium]|nr:MAG: hypothetical protein IPJ68_03320 [Candidatus Moranbacteria bacterium]